ncbi:polymer-forming cytoskeletal protein [Aeromonas caviae]|nr:polymer-forming cytoskeletal protein [Aeromonas caviae]
MSSAFDAINTGTYFPAVVQGHHGVEAAACTNVPNPQFSEVNQPKINGTGGNKLAFCSISANQNNTKNCDDGQGGYKVCAITGQDIAGLSLTWNNAFPTNGSTTDLNCTNNGSAALSQKAYRTVTSSGCQLTMTAQPGYQIKSLTMSNGGTLTLGPGDHFFETLSLDSTTIKLQSVDQALTRIFVKNTPTLRNNFSLNAGGKQNLIWVSYGDFAMQSGSFVGYLYAGGKVTLSNQATLTGRITARALEIRDNSVINKGDAVLPSPTCKDIFTDPPTEGASMTPPPGVLVPPLGDLVCSKQGSGTSCTGHSGNSFGPGDHDFDDGSISNQAEIIATGVTARLYFNNLDLNNARLNLHNPPEHLFIYVKGDLSIAGQNQINAVVYVAGNVRMAGNATLEGALATGGNVDISGNGDYEFDQDAVDKVDLGGNTCGGSTGGSQIDHFELSHSGQALTCNPEAVVIKACADASCSRLVAEQVSASLSLTPDTASNGWLGGNQLTFSGGSTTARLHNNTAGTVTMGVAGSTPAFQHPTLCRAGSGVPSVAACTLSFADSGFLFDVPDTLANKPQDVVISAVKKDDATKQCVPGFADVSKPVSFWGSYVTPNANAFGSQIRIDGNPVSTYAANVASPAGTVINVNFDSQGKATLKRVNYPDAGQMRLNARHDGSGDTAGLVMTGSDLFVSRPVGLCITPTQGACAAGDASCPVFKRTGEAFQLNIAGVAWQADDDKDLCRDNLATPNFALANIALGSELVAPKPGEEAVVGTASYDHSNAKGNNNLNTLSQSVNEVGVFRMTATPPTLGYFGYTIPAASSVPVGRFIPVDFNLVSGNIVPACEAFSYMGQPFLAELQIQARNQFGETTLNYREAFAKGDAYLSAANNKDGVSLSARLRSLGPLPWVAGEADFNGPTEFARRSDGKPDGPYRALSFGLYMKDNDGEQTLIANPDFNDGQPGSCSGAGCNARLIDDVPMEAYFGRVQTGTRQGVATAGLAVPLQLQYHEAGAWHAMGADQCTRLSLQDGGIEFTDGSQRFDQGSGDLILDDNTRIRLGLGPVAPGAMVASAKDGVISIQFAAPDRAVRIPFKIDLSKQPESEQQPGRRPLWLSDPDSLEGMAIFGRDRGNDRIIYRREVMP